MTGVNDALDNAGDARSATVSHAATSTDPDYEMPDLASSTVAVTVTDDDVPAVTIADADPVTEGDGSDVTFTVTADIAPHRDLTVALTVTDGAGDYIGGSAPTSVTIQSGTTEATLAVPVADDNVDEADGTVTVTLSAPGQNAGYRLGSTTTATGAVADDDVPEVSIADAAGVTEGSALTFTVTASPAPYQALTVALVVDDGAGDFLPGSGVPTSVTVPTGGSVTVSVPTQGDSVDEADGTVTVTLSAPGQNAGYRLGSATTATGAVADDDVPEVSIADAAGVTEGTALTFTVTASPAPYQALTVALAVDDGAGDFLPGSGVPTSVTVPTGGSVTVNVPTEGDSVDEADGTVTVTLTAPGQNAGYQLGSADHRHGRGGRRRRAGGEHRRCGGGDGGHGADVHGDGVAGAVPGADGGAGGGRRRGRLPAGQRRSDQRDGADRRQCDGDRADAGRQRRRGGRDGRGDAERAGAERGLSTGKPDHRHRHRGRRRRPAGAVGGFSARHRGRQTGR